MLEFTVRDSICGAFAVPLDMITDDCLLSELYTDLAALEHLRFALQDLFHVPIDSYALRAPATTVGDLVRLLRRLTGLA